MLLCVFLLGVLISILTIIIKIVFSILHRTNGPNHSNMYDEQLVHI